MTVAAVAIGAGLAAGPASATANEPSSFSLKIKSTTSLSVESAAIVPGDNGALLPGDEVTVEAVVRPGFLVLSGGEFQFTDETTDTALETVPMPSTCFLHFTTCAVFTDVDSSQLDPGANTITGSYSGNFFLAPSSGTAQLFLESQTTTDGVTTTECGDACVTDGQTSSDETTEAYISAAAGSSASVTEQFSSSTTLPCTTTGGGDILIFSSTGITSNKTILLQAIGADADTLESVYFGGEHLCYESPTVFTTAGGTAATIDPTTGLYAGILPQCQLPSGGGESGYDGDATNPPCEDFSEFYNAGGEGPDLYNQQFETTAADPRASN